MISPKAFVATESQKQRAPGASVASGHTVENSIPLSIFPIQLDKFCICICGLPGTGKTHIARRLDRYLSFFHAVPVAMYNASEYRREKFGLWTSNKYFDQTNQANRQMLDDVNGMILGEMSDFLNKTPNGVAILDSSSLLLTTERRMEVQKMVNAAGAKVMFIEVMNEGGKDGGEELRIPYDSPDYAGMSPEDAEKDYTARVEIYRRSWQSLNSTETEGKEDSWSYLQCDPYRKHFVIHNVSGYLQLKIVHFIINLRPDVANLYLSRHGQSQFNALGRIGGDSSLSEHGENYAHKLADWVKDVMCVEEQDEGGTVKKIERPCRLWTSTMKRTKETAQYISSHKFKVQDKVDPSVVHEWVQMRARAWHHLDELFAGQCDGMTYEEIEETYPEEFRRRKTDKLAYRYPRGESYLDVIARLEPMIIEMERHREPLLVVGHQGILRIIYAFYMGLSRAEAPYVSIPLNTVTHLQPGAFSCSVARTTLYKIELPSDGQDEPLAVRMERLQAVNDPSSH